MASLMVLQTGFDLVWLTVSDLEWHLESHSESQRVLPMGFDSALQTASLKV